ncbi:MAG TPA: hypothetical protein VGB85_15185 [Nannocystis sp.]|jgi:hypothetical protein
MRPLRTLLVLAALTGCARPAPPPVAPAPSPAPAPVAVAPAPALQIRLLPRLTPTPRLGVEIVAQGLVDRAWKVAALVAADLRDLQINDDDGPLAFASRRDGLAMHVTLGRAPRGPLRISYVLHGEPVEVATQDVPAALTLRIDNDRVLASGEELLLLPAAARPDPIGLRLELAPEGPIVRLVSTLGVEPGTPARARLEDLRHALFLAGTTGHALLRSPAGEDDFAWTGDPMFDLRWSAAETAGTRTAVDAYFGATPEEVVRFTALFSVELDLPGVTGAQVLPRGGGLYVALPPGAGWDAQARLAVTQGLVHRWLGGRLRLQAGAGDPPEAGAWFADGFARFVAREVLFDLGTLSLEDYADEVNGHHAELVTSRSRAATIAALASAAATGDHDAAALLLARGVLYATRIDALIRAKHRGARSLRALLRELVAEARARNVGALPLQAFTDRLRGELGEAEVALFQRTVLGGEPLTLPADALGPCFTRGPRTYTRFELGFDEAASRAVTPGQVRGVRPGGPAARAGVLAGERMLALDYLPGDPGSPVELTLERDGREQVVSYRPVGGTARGDAWRRRPGIDEARCVR